MISPLKARSAPIDQWIRNTVDIGSHAYKASLIGKVIFRYLLKNQNARCFMCVKQDRLKRDCRQDFPRNNIFER